MGNCLRKRFRKNKLVDGANLETDANLIDNSNNRLFISVV